MSPGSSASYPITLLSLPNELLLAHIFPFLFPDDIVVLGWTNSWLHQLALDNGYWRRRIIQDLEIPLALRGDIFPSDTDGSSITNGEDTSIPRPQGHFRRLYFGLLYPRVFWWGSWDNRLVRPQPTDAASDTSNLPQPLDVTYLFPRPEGIHSMQSWLNGLVCGDLKDNLRVWGAMGRTPIPTRLELDEETQLAQSCDLFRGNASKSTRTFTAGPESVVNITLSGNVFCRSSSWVPPEPESLSYGSPRQIHFPCGGRAEQIAALDSFSVVLVDGCIYVLRRSKEVIPVMPLPKREAGIWWVGSEEPLDRAEWETRWAAEAKAADGSKCKTSTTDGARGVEGDDGGERVVRVAAGFFGAYAVKRNGEVWVASLIEDDARLGEWRFLPCLSAPTNHDIASGFCTVAVLRTDAWPISGVLMDRGPYYVNRRRGRPPTPVIQQVASEGHWSVLTQDGAVYFWTLWGDGPWTLPELDEDEPPDLPERMHFPPNTRVFCISSYAALALGDGRVPAWLGRSFGDEPPVKSHGKPIFAPPVPPRSSLGPIRRTIDRIRNWWHGFKLLRDEMDYHF